MIFFFFFFACFDYNINVQSAGFLCQSVMLLTFRTNTFIFSVHLCKEHEFKDSLAVFIWIEAGG